MTLYVDTSNLVKLYIEERDSDRIRDLIHAADVVVTSVLAYPEARAAFARRRRERLMTRAELIAAVTQLNADWPRFVTMPFEDDLARAAGRLADEHTIRGADAVHLASFEALAATCEDDDLRFSCADDHLTRAARRLS